MADGGINSKNNFSRFQVFSGGLPANISTFGYTTDEVKIQAGTPERDVRIAPMASPQVTETQLALAPAGSDLNRLASPNDPQFNPYEGPKSMLSLNRDALAKLQSPIIEQVRHIVDDLKNQGAPNADLMGDSAGTRLRTLVWELTSLTDMASQVKANQAQNLS
ncbi:MAG: hypothetical protein AAFP04_04065 [Myxococcota bacterium]